MTGKIKFTNDRKNRFASKELKRKKNFRSKRKFYLIVCEGTKTEPNYFQSLKEDLPKGVLTSCQIDIEGTGHNTQSLLNEALRLKKLYEQENSRPIDRFWVVFDRDSFPSNDFNNAIIRCQSSNPKIGCAWSNEAFELWYLLHFHYYNNGMSRRDYQDAIEMNLKQFLGEDYRYKKNNTEMYSILKENGNMDDAIRNAKRLVSNFGSRQDYSNHNPCTMVWKLIEELNSLKS